MNRLYVVVGITVNYDEHNEWLDEHNEWLDEHNEWLVAAYSDKKLADKHAELLTIKVKEEKEWVNASKRRLFRINSLKPLDPHSLHNSYNLYLNYEVKTCNLLEAIPDKNPKCRSRKNAK